MTSFVQQNQVRQDETEHRPAGKPWTRNHATSRLADEISRARQQPGYEFSILLIEFAGLSALADRLGYASGDTAWQRALAVLTQDLRANDLCCRLGGDEYLLIFPGRGQADARKAMDRLNRSWNPGAGTREASIVVSVGVASYPGHGATVEMLLAAADESLHVTRLRTELVRSTRELDRLSPRAST